jgi:hypothetical protein
LARRENWGAETGGQNTACVRYLKP